MTTFRYTADTHFNQAYVLAKRATFQGDMAMMNFDLHEKLVQSTAMCRLIHCGDVAMNFRKYVDGTRRITTSPTPHICVLGNHDNIKGGRAQAYLDSFGVLVGSQKTWRDNSIRLVDQLDGKSVVVLVSHAPQQDLQGADFNVHGHLHANILDFDDGLPPHHPEYIWTYDSPQHFNAGVDVHFGFPMDLAELQRAHAMRYAGRRL